MLPTVLPVTARSLRPAAGGIHAQDQGGSSTSNLAWLTRVSVCEPDFSVACTVHTYLPGSSGARMMLGRGGGVKGGGCVGVVRAKQRCPLVADAVERGSRPGGDAGRQCDGAGAGCSGWRRGRLHGEIEITGLRAQDAQ